MLLRLSIVVGGFVRSVIQHRLVAVGVGGGGRSGGNQLNVGVLLLEWFARFDDGHDDERNFLGRRRQLGFLERRKLRQVDVEVQRPGGSRVDGVIVRPLVLNFFG